MKNNYLYYFKKTRKQRSKLFLFLGSLFLFYFVALLILETNNNTQTTTGINLLIYSILVAAAIISFIISSWNILNPAVLEIAVTENTIMIDHPGKKHLSFKVNVSDIVKIEKRYNFYNGGMSIATEGLLMKNGEYKTLTTHYGNSLKPFYNSLKVVRPELFYK